MIDHVLGRPSTRFRKIQVLLVLTFWTSYLLRGHSHGPPLLRRLSTLLTPRLTTFQTITLTMLYLYFARNFAKLTNLESPEPMANLYTRSYFRATWIMTALDAGFWTAMGIRTKWIRDVASVVFSGYYLVAAERAEEKVRRVRSVVTVEHLRVGWEKNTTPYLKFLARIAHPLRNRYPPRHVLIQRPGESKDRDSPVEVWVYFEGTKEELSRQRKLVLDLPGGGFVAMGPKNHEDKLIGWSRKLKVPIVSVDYKKAPEFPYPYAVNECYDVYHQIVATRGRCVGLSGDAEPRIVVTGDSAGGNFAAGVTLMVLASGEGQGGDRVALPPPAGVLLVYPCLDMNIASWMDDDLVRLIRERGARAVNRGVVRRKSGYFAQASGGLKALSSHTTNASSSSQSQKPNVVKKKPSPRTLGVDYDSSDSENYDDDDSNEPTDMAKYPATSTTLSTTTGAKQSTLPPSSSTNPNQPKLLSTRLAMTSRLTYFNDRVLTPEMMRAMVILYIGPHNRPDFTKDYLLSPIVAPDSLLARFPRTMFLTGERDPLVDDTVIFAGKIARAKRATIAAGNTRPQIKEKEFPLVRLIPGISHGFLLMAGMFPEAKREIVRCARWIGEVLDDEDDDGVVRLEDEHGNVDELETRPRHHHRTDTGTTSVGMATTDDEQEEPLDQVSKTQKNNNKKRTPYLAPNTSTTTTTATSLSSSTSPAAGRGGASVRGGRGGLSKGRLGSEEDLVGRRMQGLMGGLTGLEDLDGVLPS